jgi:hypothetical protein
MTTLEAYSSSSDEPSSSREEDERSGCLMMKAKTPVLCAAPSAASDENDEDEDDAVQDIVSGNINRQSQMVLMEEEEERRHRNSDPTNNNKTHHHPQKVDASTEYTTTTTRWRNDSTSRDHQQGVKKKRQLSQQPQDEDNDDGGESHDDHDHDDADGQKMPAVVQQQHLLEDLKDSAVESSTMSSMMSIKSQSSVGAMKSKILDEDTREKDLVDDIVSNAKNTHSTTAFRATRDRNGADREEGISSTSLTRSFNSNTVTPGAVAVRGIAFGASRNGPPGGGGGRGERRYSSSELQIEDTPSSGNVSGPQHAATVVHDDDLEQDFRERIQKEMVDAVAVVPLGSSEEFHREEQALKELLEKKKAEEARKRRLYRRLVGLLLLALVLGAVLLGVVLSSSSSDNARGETPTSRPTSAPTLSERDYLIQLLSIEDDDSLLLEEEDSLSPQLQALDWMTEQNQLEMWIVYDPQNAVELKQRFSLAVLYFSTGGPTEWVESLGFLEPIPACEWTTLSPNTTNGIVCDDGSPRLVTDIVLGTCWQFCSGFLCP